MGCGESPSGLLLLEHKGKNRSGGQRPQITWGPWEPPKGWDLSKRSRSDHGGPTHGLEPILQATMVSQGQPTEPGSPSQGPSTAPMNILPPADTEA